MHLTLILEFRHEKYVTQYRAVFVMNCTVKDERSYQHVGSGPKGGKRRRGSSKSEAGPVTSETFKHVCCSVCSTDVGVIDEDEVYHFYNTLPSES